ncbi:MAG: Clp protease N-terminal domain-containing protein [Methyloligellaceae bacterium]
MVQSFADSFSWIQKSSDLKMTFDRAFIYARNMSHKLVMLEHLLLALVDDPDAQIVLQVCRVDRARLQAEVQGLIEHEFGPLVDPNSMPATSDAFSKVLTHAVAAGEQSNRPVIDGAIILAALIGEGGSPAAEILKKNGLTFDAAIRSLGNERSAPASPYQYPEQHNRIDQGQSQYPVQNGSSYSNGSHSHQLDSSVEDILSNVREIIGTEDQGLDPLSPSKALVQNTGVHQPHLNGAESTPYNNGTHVDNQHAYTNGASESGFVPMQDAPQNSMHSNGYHQRDVHHEGVETALQTGQLIENVPRRMRVAIPEIVEVRIARASLQEIEGQSAQSAYQQGHSTKITEALTVQLRAPKGMFLIETSSPETQWIDRFMGFGEDFARWRWNVTPLKRGKQRLDLVISGRLVGAQGILSENILPEQIIDVKVRTNYFKLLTAVLGIVLVAGLGALAMHFGPDLLRLTGLVS